MLWYFFELFFLTNILILIFPLSIRIKRLWSLFTYSVLSGWLLLFLSANIKFIRTLSLATILSYSAEHQIYFFFPAVFILDNLTCIFCFLTLFLAVVALLVTWRTPGYASSGFLLVIWAITFSLFHTFSSDNILLFYVFFEVSLFPMSLLILIWGSRQRKVHAMFMFFFYTVFGSFFLLLGIFYLYSLTSTFFIPNLTYIRVPEGAQLLLWALFFLGFAVKVPVVPAHTWLPEAHVEAPTTGSIILAGLLLKIGTFGMLRFMFPHLNHAAFIFRPLIFVLALLSIYHASLVALRQIDLKKAIAYSSVAHMGFVLLGLFSLNIYGVLGSLFIMFSHGLVASALFFLVGVIYDRFKSRNILDYGGLASIMPNYSVLFFFFTLANLSFPGTSNFIGEAYSLIGLTEVDYVSSLFATFSIVLTSSYSIWMYNRVVYGPVNTRLIGFSDINKLEFVIGGILLLLTCVYGFLPRLLTSGVECTAFKLIIQ